MLEWSNFSTLKWRHLIGCFESRDNFPPITVLYFRAHPQFSARTQQYSQPLLILPPLWSSASTSHFTSCEPRPIRKTCSVTSLLIKTKRVARLTLNLYCNACWCLREMKDGILPFWSEYGLPAYDSSVRLMLFKRQCSNKLFFLYFSASHIHLCAR